MRTGFNTESLPYLHKILPTITQGLPIEIFGSEDSGKTTLGIELLKLMGGQSLIIDGERTIVESTLPSGMLVARPSNVEDAMELCLTCLRDSSVQNILYDSIISLPSQKEESKDDIIQFYRSISSGFSKLAPYLINSKKNLIWINQIRTRLFPTIMDTTAGGRFLKNFAQYRLEVLLLQQDANSGIISQLKLVKSPELKLTGLASKFYLKIGNGILTTPP